MNYFSGIALPNYPVSKVPLLISRAKLRNQFLKFVGTFLELNKISSIRIPARPSISNFTTIFLSLFV